MDLWMLVFLRHIYANCNWWLLALSLIFSILWLEICWNGIRTKYLDRNSFRGVIETRSHFKIISPSLYPYFLFWQVPSQHVIFFYALSYLRAPQNRHANFSFNSWIIFIFEYPNKKFTLYLCTGTIFIKISYSCGVKCVPILCLCFLYFPQKFIFHFYISKEIGFGGKTSARKNSLLCHVRNLRGYAYFYSCWNHVGSYIIGSSLTFREFWTRKHVLGRTTGMASEIWGG